MGVSSVTGVGSLSQRSTPKAPPTPRQVLAALAAPYRYRVRLDAEGWPMIPGRYGRLEWHDGRELAVYTDRPRLFARLWAVSGVRRWQVGDREARGLFPVQALPAVAAVIQARKRRAGHPAGLRNLLPALRHSATPAA